MVKSMTDMVDSLEVNGVLPDEEMRELLKYRNKEITKYLFDKAYAVKEKYYGKDVYIRGTIEMTNYCKNDCYYCGLRRSNKFIPRFRLDENEIMQFCDSGYEKGVRTFVLMGGDDYSFTEDKVAKLISMIKERYEDCAIELCLGERPSETYARWFQAGADRYLLWHEAAGENYFRKVHPPDMSLLKRKQSLWELKRIGYQVGSGFMVGLPYQMVANVVEDLNFLKAFEPHIIHLTPFIPTAHTRYENDRSGNGEMTIYLMAILRLMLPRTLITADPALENVMADARKKAFQAGANEVFASITTDEIKEYYNVYNKKLSRRNTLGDEVTKMQLKIEESGNIAPSDRGDYNFPKERENVYGKAHHIM